jgi:hypothetical protein
MSNRSLSYKKPKSRSYSKRQEETRELRERFLIVCEGEKTEPNYFESFPVPKSIRHICGLGANTVSLVKEAVKLRDDDGNYAQVWCVFDRDSFPAQNFNAAIALAKQEGIKVAYSNEAFELWYLLHFNYYDTGVSRKDYIKKLDNLLGHKYEKNSEKIYYELEGKQQAAIKHAKKLLGQYSPPKPECDNPSTTVHLLVEQLNRFIRP